MRAKEFVAFIKEREKVRLAKKSGKPRPWTKDPIINKYRFCNVHREDDYVSQWLRANWYLHLRGDPDIWFAAVVARLLNQPDALYEIMPYVLPFKPEKIRKLLHARRDAGKKNFNAAYIVSTNGVAMDKVDYIIARVLGPLWASRKDLRGVPRSLAEFHAMLTRFDGLGSFVAAQVIADLKYLPEWRDIYDWDTFAASGPGSRRGLNRVLGRPPETPWREVDWQMVLEELADKAAVKQLALHAQDLQNCLCEFDKYKRARLGEGEPKQLYKERSDEAQ